MMMKRTVFLTGMLAALLTFALALAGCSNGTTDSSDPGPGELPQAIGANALSGKTYFDNERKIVFAETLTGATSGGYKIWHTTQTGGNPELEGGKYKYTETENGTYSWDENAKTVTLKPEKVANKEEGVWSSLMTEAQYRVFIQAMLAEFSDAEILAETGGTRSQYLELAVKESFDKKTDGYDFSNDDLVLFLDEALPANDGTNYLTGKIFDSESQPSVTVEFTSATYTVKNSGTEIETGEYGYGVKDGNDTYAFLKPLKVNGETKSEHYDSVGNPAVGYFESADAAKAAQVNGNFTIKDKKYNSTTLKINY